MEKPLKTGKSVEKNVALELPTKLDVTESTKKALEDFEATVIGAEVEEDKGPSDSYKGQKFDDAACYEQALNAIKNLEEVEDLIGTVEDLRALTVEQLIQLEDKYPGILLYAFTDIVGEDTKLDFDKWNAYKQPVPGMRLVINFRGNAEAERKIGSGDMMSVSVRAITVYEDGDANTKRTSDVRIGLKGKNESGTGFFDEAGYMPIYTGDVVVIGGETKPEAGIDLGFEKRFPTKEAYEKSDEFKQAWAKLVGSSAVASDRPNRPKGARKVLTPAEAAKYMESLSNGSVGARLMKSIQTIIDRKVYPDHCWDWLNTVFQNAGVTRKVRIYQNLNYEGRDCGDCHAPDELVAALKPGDWVYYNNRNTSDKHGNHSAIFCGWKDEGKRIALVASGSHGRIGRYHTADFIDQPVTHITRPVA